MYFLAGTHRTIEHGACGPGEAFLGHGATAASALSFAPLARDPPIPYCPYSGLRLTAGRGHDIMNERKRKRPCATWFLFFIHNPKE